MTETQRGALEFATIYLLWAAVCFALAIGQRYMSCQELSTSLGVPANYSFELQNPLKSATMERCHLQHRRLGR